MGRKTGSGVRPGRSVGIKGNLYEGWREGSPFYCLGAGMVGRKKKKREGTVK